MTQRYETYKDSGVQWLGEIPGHWDFTTMNKVASIVLGKMLQNDSIRHDDILTKYICAKDVHFEGIDTSDLKLMYFSLADLNLYLVKQGDMLVVEGGAGAGNCAIIKQPIENVGIQNSIMIVRSKGQSLNEYLCYYLANIVQRGYVKMVTNIATIPHFTKEKVSRTIIPLPPLSEQQAIVSYLDTKCGQIDKMLEGKQKQIELLQEMKQRVIADAVTRGLNPDVKMKATNIPWLPEIPEHWETRKMKYLFTERSEKNHPDEPMLSATQTEGVILQSKYKGRVVVVNTGFEGLKLVRVGDFVIHLRSFQGGIEIAYDQGIISSAYTILSLNQTEQSDYFKYLFKSIPFIDLLKTCVTGIREGQNINYSKLKQNQLPVPPLAEQQAIVSYIQERTTKIDLLASKLQQEIDNIKEYKQRLISDVVTGQIKVC